VLAGLAFCFFLLKGCFGLAFFFGRQYSELLHEGNWRCEGPMDEGNWRCEGPMDEGHNVAKIQMV
jgi:hypothetical protein